MMNFICIIMNFELYPISWIHRKFAIIKTWKERKVVFGSEEI